MTGRYVIDSRLFLAVVLTVLGLAVTGLAFKVWILDEQRADQLTCTPSSPTPTWTAPTGPRP